MSWWKRRGDAESEQPVDDDAPVVLTIGRDRFEVDLIVRRLRTEGITASHGPRDGSRPHLDDHTIYVARRDHTRASELLDGEAPPTA